MDNGTGGYYRMHRDWHDDSRLFANAEVWRVFTWCLKKANFKDCTVQFRAGRAYRSRQLFTGEFIFGRDSAARELGRKASSVWGWLKRLQEMGYIKINSDSECSIVTVCNWRYYQTSPLQARQRFNSDSTAKCDSDSPNEGAEFSDIDNSGEFDTENTGISNTPL